MIGLDTNILIRFIMQDNPEQSIAVSALLNQLTIEEPGYISVGTLLEMVWVLKTRYRVPKSEIVLVLDHLQRTRTLLLQHEREVSRAFASWQTGPGSFSDLLIAELNVAAGCSTTFTFDKEAITVTRLSSSYSQSGVSVPNSQTAASAHSSQSPTPKT